MYKKIEFQIGHLKPMEDIEIILKKNFLDAPTDTMLMVSVKSVIVKQEDAIPFVFGTNEITEGLKCIQEWLPKLIPESRFLPKCNHSMVVYLIEEGVEPPDNDEVYSSLMKTMEKMLAEAK